MSVTDAPLRKYHVRVTRFTTVAVIAESPEEAEDFAVDIAGGRPDRCWDTDTEVESECSSTT